MSAAGLRRARLVWMAFAVILLVPTVASWLIYYGLVHRICDTCPITPELAQGLTTLGWSLELWTAWKLLWPIFITVTWAGVGLLIFARRSDDYGALLMSAAMVLVPPGLGGMPPMGAAGLLWSSLAKIARLSSVPALFALIALFPNGRFAPRWTRWLLLYVTIVFAPNFLFPSSPLAFSNWPGLASGVFVFIPLLGSLIALPVYRYWRVFNAIERQQTRWAVLGFIAAGAVILATQFVSAPYFSVAEPPPERVLLGELIQGLGYGVGPSLIPIFIGIAILRSRLWDIDVIIRRTLVYSVLTGLLALAYLGSILVLQNVFQTLTGQVQDQLVTVISTLGIAALFVPLRRRVQEFIDHRFFRLKYDAAKIVMTFSNAARDEVELSQLTARLIDTVDAAMRPAHSSLWLKGGGKPDRQL